MAMAEGLVGLVPFLPRFARALTGSQSAGDACVVAAIEQLLEDKTPFLPARIGLYRAVLHQVNGLESQSITLGLPTQAMESVQRNLAGLIPWADKHFCWWRWKDSPSQTLR